MVYTITFLLALFGLLKAFPQDALVWKYIPESQYALTNPDMQRLYKIKMIDLELGDFVITKNRFGELINDEVIGWTFNDPSHNHIYEHVTWYPLGRNVEDEEGDNVISKDKSNPNSFVNSKVPCRLRKPSESSLII